MSLFGDDGWIRFQTPLPVSFREEPRLRPCPEAPLRRFFTGAGVTVPDGAVARCAEDGASGTWVLSDPATGTHFLRSWSAE